MKETSVELSILFDCYSGMLTEKQRICFDLYYNQDLSLSEIAEESGISRQGVHDTLARTENALRTMEEQLKCGEREHKIRHVASELREIAEKLHSEHPDYSAEMISLLDELEKE